MFQPLPHNPLVDAIESVSQSDLSHCGIIVKLLDKWMVLESIGEVQYTPLSDWEDRGRDYKFLAYRFKPEKKVDIAKFIENAKSYIGRGYDYHYSFDNSEIYCSELPFLAFQKITGKPLGKVRKLRDLNWQPNEKFIRSIENNELPLDRTMITPIDLSKAVELEPVYP